MSTIDLDVQEGNIHFKIAFDRRINFVVGNSASGKTTLWDMINRAPGDSNIKVRSTYPLMVVSEINYQIILSNLTNSVVVIDDLSIIETAEFTSLIKNACVKNNLWLLIMSREDEEHLQGGKKLSFSLNSIFKLVSKNGVVVNEKYYSFGDTGSNAFDAVLVEDSKAGYTFFKSLFEGSYVESATSGKSTILMDVKRMMQDGKQSIFIVFDTASFGCHCGEFFSYFINHKELEISFMPFYECFEELLIRTNLLRNLSLVRLGLSDLFKYANKYVSWENYFEDLIERATDGKQYSHKHSSNLKSCYYRSCDDCPHYRKSKCDNVLSGEDKFKELLSETIYEFLLDFKCD